MCLPWAYFDGRQYHFEMWLGSLRTYRSPRLKHCGATGLGKARV